MDDVTPKKALPFMLHSVTIFFPTMLSVPVTLLITKFFSVTAILNFFNHTNKVFGAVRT